MSALRTYMIKGHCHVARQSHQDDAMRKSKSLYHGHRFPAAVISCAARWYFRLQLSLRDVEELPFGRGVVVSYETIRRWCDKFGAGYARRVNVARPKLGSGISTRCS